MLFRQLNIGDTFDFISETHILNSFYLRCYKTGRRTYQDEKGTRHEVGSIDAAVYHVEARKV